ncbi:MAG: flagellar hook protein FlgE [Gracilibacteraceae bacterium]|jgi:flagellar hook protein FlgE|nr:flagellar hook protein FlgE [Gracilibacteraceae bacterium]
MMRSMFSGVSGLRAHQLKMDTIGNNIANVNTVGYKTQRATFQEVFNQTLRGAGSPQAGKGGTNPQQVGLGISLSSIDTFHIRGAVQRTDNLTDLAINGDGFFILSNSSDNLSRSYTRAGNFSLDDDGNLVAANGYRVLGYMVDPDTNVLKSQLEGIKISKAEMVSAKATTYSTFEGNLDNTITQITDDTIPEFDAGLLKIPAGCKFWETTATVYDSLGGKHTLKYTFFRGIESDGSLNPESTDDSLENNWAVVIQNQDTKEYYTNTGAQGGGANLADIVIHLEFGKDGLLDAANSINGTGKIQLTVNGKNGSEEIKVDIDFTKLTQFANESNAAVTSSDGYPQGSLDTFSIGPTGEINGIFTNGMSKIIGQVALAVFKNPAGLEKTAENMYQVTPNSGDPIVGLPGSSGLGSLNSGTLEMSNVDISNEFAEMISTQRGFQANSRIITTSDEMLQELVNLKR